jgi:hypothetical protein
MRVRLHDSGSIRFKRRFAWRPTIVENYRIWLEFYYAEEVYLENRWMIQRKFLD